MLNPFRSIFLNKYELVVLTRENVSDLLCLSSRAEGWALKWALNDPLFACVLKVWRALIDGPPVHGSSSPHASLVAEPGSVTTGQKLTFSFFK